MLVVARERERIELFACLLVRLPAPLRRVAAVVGAVRVGPKLSAFGMVGFGDRLFALLDLRSERGLGGLLCALRSL